MKRSLAEVLNTTNEPEVIPETLYSTIIEAMRKKLLGTQFVALRIGPSGCKGSNVQIISSTKDALKVYTVAEGTDVPMSKEGFTKRTLTPLKYGTRPVITKEMQEDSQWDQAQRALVEAGYQMAKKLDSLIMSAIEAGNTVASNTVSGGAAITIDNITQGMYNLEVADYTPTDLICSAEVIKDIRNIDTFVEADKSGVTDPSKSLIGTIFGMQVWFTNQVTAKYAYIIDRDHAIALVEKRPLTIEGYKDEIKDLSGLVLTARWVASYKEAGACCVITTS